uniref:uncharacterized protein LOC118536715 n=1 Tax=Halichoerus grypus TaxID=9711 RepID=UPI001658E689|nr:uncharacterized protein LOC118536715 [Halichoerus grypus]
MGPLPGPHCPYPQRSPAPQYPCLSPRADECLPSCHLTVVTPPMPSAVGFLKRRAVTASMAALAFSAHGLWSPWCRCHLGLGCDPSFDAGPLSRVGGRPLEDNRGLPRGWSLPGPPPPDLPADWPAKLEHSTKDNSPNGGPEAGEEDLPLKGALSLLSQTPEAIEYLVPQSGGFSWPQSGRPQAPEREQSAAQCHKQASGPWAGSPCLPPL